MTIFMPPASRALAAALALAALTACSSVSDEDHLTPAPIDHVPSDGGPTPDGEQAPRLAATTTGLTRPESVRFDPATNTWFTSNVGEMSTPGDGFISQLDADGKVLSLHFADGLDDPRGIDVHDGTLYVADNTGLVAIRIDTPAEREHIPLAHALFPNDVAVDHVSGDVYVSDSFGNAIYEVVGRTAQELVRDAALETPNGLHVAGRTLYVASIGPDPDPETFQPREPGRVFTLELDTLRLTPLTPRFASLDGIEPDGNDLLVSDTFRGLFRVRQDGTSELVLDCTQLQIQGCADIGFDPARRRVAIPELFASRVLFFEL